MSDMFWRGRGCDAMFPPSRSAALLVPTDENAQVAHRTVSLVAVRGHTGSAAGFPVAADRGRRVADAGARTPVDAHGLFDVERKPFAPELAVGQRLAFTLRVNATVSRATASGRSHRCDVVMDALSNVPKEQRAVARPEAMQTAAHGWLQRQGDAHGFTLHAVAVDGYERVAMPRPSGGRAIFGVLDLSGVLEVTHPELLVAKLGQGFGRARAFGCGLMLVRRVH